MSTDQAQRPLTLKQERFVTHYITTGNATQAAINAEYSPKTAAETGYENLRKPQIALAIQQRKAELERTRKLTPDDVMNGLLAEARTADTASARVSAWRTLADILGMTAGNARELPDALNSMLEAVARGLAAGSKQAAISEPRTIEIGDARTSHASDSDDV